MFSGIKNEKKIKKNKNSRKKSPHFIIYLKCVDFLHAHIKKMLENYLDRHFVSIIIERERKRVMKKNK